MFFHHTPDIQVDSAIVATATIADLTGPIAVVPDYPAQAAARPAPRPGLRLRWTTQPGPLGALLSRWITD